jgi:DNA-binding beta-propeller fold protein YncE
MVFLFSCRSDKPQDELQPSITINPNGGVIIINEGLFQVGNATAGYYNKADNTYINDLFQPINKRPLGDVFQSMTVFNRKAYLVINNSGKIEIVNPESFLSIGTINGLVSPRYFLPVSYGKAYVSNYKSNAINIVDLNSNTITGSITCGYGRLNEEMALSYGKAYVTSPSSNKLYVINTRTDLLEDSISIGRGASTIREDTNGKLWVLCSGKESANELAGLYRINPVTNKVEWSIGFPDKTFRPSNLVTDGGHQNLFYISKEGVFKFSIKDTVLPALPIIPKGTMYLYGLGVDPKNGTIYTGDAAGFTADGIVSRYKPDGAFINSFTTGIGPNGFCFN